MKTNKLIAAGAMALSMAMTPVASLINAMPIAAKEVDVTVDISGFDENSIHTFAAYQVFSGNQASDGSLGDIEWKNLETSIPSFVTIIMMVLGYSIAEGIASGFVLYPIMMLAARRQKEVHPVMWALMVIFFIHFVLA